MIKYFQLTYPNVPGPPDSDTCEMNLSHLAPVRPPGISITCFTNSSVLPASLSVRIFSFNKASCMFGGVISIGVSHPLISRIKLFVPNVSKRCFSDSSNLSKLISFTSKSVLGFVRLVSLTIFPSRNISPTPPFCIFK